MIKAQLARAVFMGKRRGILMVMVLTILFTVTSFASDESKKLEEKLKKFYNGAAVVINKNIDDPDKCVKEVSKYYDDNGEDISEIRELSEKYMTQLAVMLGQYDGVGGGWEDIDYDIESGILDKSGLARTQPFMDYETMEYKIALEKFSILYPFQALSIAQMALEFSPVSISEEIQMP